MAIAPIRPLTWEPPYAAGAALEKTKKKKKFLEQYSHHGTAEMNLTRNHEVKGLIPGLAQWVKDLCCHELWCKLQMQPGSEVAMVLA